MRLAPTGRTIGPRSTSETTGTVVIDVTGTSGSWTLYGPSGSSSGTGDTTLTEQPTGAYYVAFTAASGYLTPGNAFGLLTDGATLTLSGTYLEATGLILAPVNMLKDIIASSATFQAWTGNAGDKNAALAYIHRFEAPSPDLTKVICVVSYASGLSYNKEAGGEGNVYNVSGPLRAFFTERVATGNKDNMGDAVDSFVGNLENVIEEIQNLSDVGGSINLNAIELEDPPMRETYEEESGKNEYFECHVDFTYGV